ncbi:MAG: sugar ABC transporter permease, partial [Alistipes sp.]|nr:sugar ABC transporter permease [Alistipes sp.]
MSFGSNTLIFTNAINAVDKEILESAMIDGANDRVQFFGIVMPLIWPTFTTYVVTGLTGMFTWSGALMTFYMYGAPPHIWGLGYYFTVTIKNTGTMGFMNYPKVATAGLFVTIISTPLVFAV